jgi:hypothetical protein
MQLVSTPSPRERLPDRLSFSQAVTDYLARPLPARPSVKITSSIRFARQRQGTEARHRSWPSLSKVSTSSGPDASRISAAWFARSSLFT